jgi:hypothetical protein
MVALPSSPDARTMGCDSSPSPVRPDPHIAEEILAAEILLLVSAFLALTHRGDCSVAKHADLDVIQLQRLMHTRFHIRDGILFKVFLVICRPNEVGREQPVDLGCELARLSLRQATCNANSIFGLEKI